MPGEKKIFVRQMNEHVYLLDEAHHATGYLVVGSERACVIDTMNGLADMSAVVRSITDKPVIVVNTHGHPDHFFGNVYFDNARMHPRDITMAEHFIQDPLFVDSRGPMPPFGEIRGGDVIDLGGLTLEVYEAPGHSPGAILLLLKEDRILFTGDSVNQHLWMQLPECCTVEAYIHVLEGLLFLEEKADRILHGHAQGFDDIALMRALLEGLREIVAGDTENDVPYKWFMGEDMAHPFKKPEGKQFQPADAVICYRRDNIV